MHILTTTAAAVAANTAHQQQCRPLTKNNLVPPVAQVFLTEGSSQGPHFLLAQPHRLCMTSLRHARIPLLRLATVARFIYMQSVIKGGVAGYSFVACLSYLTIHRASLSRRSTVPTPNRNISNIWALDTFLSDGGGWAYLSGAGGGGYSARWGGEWWVY